MSSLRRFLIPLTFIPFLLGSGLVSADSASYVWLAKPSSTNFPQLVRWSNVSKDGAPAITKGTGLPQDPLFAEYTFTVPDPGGEMTLWGRTYDPHWSSPARWRVDNLPWQPWNPSPEVERQVAPPFVISWCSWSTTTLSPGNHTIRVELTGPRPQDNTPFFVLDALVLAKGDFHPQGTKMPEELVKDRQDQVAARIAMLENGQTDFQGKSAAIAQKVLTEDLGAMSEFDGLNDDVDRALDAQAVQHKNQAPALNGRISSALVTGTQLNLDVVWSHAFAGSVWIGLEQNRALYGTFIQAVDSSNKQSFQMTLPDNLPAGIVTVECVPIDQPTSETAKTTFDAPISLVKEKPQAYAWGIYRESGSRRTHPWNVTDGGMMMWDGKPYLPIGGMMNTRNSWTTHSGDQALPTVDLVKAQLEVLRKYGLKDIYYNAFGVEASPSAEANVINATEAAGMHYGLGVASFGAPAYNSMGFKQDRTFVVEVAPHAQNAEIRIPTVDIPRPSQRCLWVLVSANGDLLEMGQGLLNPGPHQPSPLDAKRKHHPFTQDFVLNVNISTDSDQARELLFKPELIMDGGDPTGLLEGIDNYLAKVREVYGSLALGPGMRLWIDPFGNELLANNTTVCTSPIFQTGFADSLFHKYDTIEALNQGWATKKPIADFSVAARLVPLYAHAGLVYWMDPEQNQIYTCDDAHSEGLFDLSEYKGTVVESLISRVADTLKEIADVPVVLKHNEWFSKGFVNPRTAGGQDGMGYESYCYGDSIAFHNSLVPLAEALSSARRQWTLETETSPAAFDGQKDYVGYIDRLQMLDDFDQMLKFGAKGVFTFGFSFDPGGHFQITELIRDPRQLEWMATYTKMLDAAAPKLGQYLPEVYGWFPVNIHQQQPLGGDLVPYEMDGDYLGRTGQIRMAPDSRWIVPVSRPDAQVNGLFVPWDLLTQSQQKAFPESKPTKPVFILGGEPAVDPAEGKSLPLNGFTANGIGAIASSPQWMTLEEFREKILGYRVFQTSDANGQTLPDGRVMVWTCVERDKVDLRLPDGTSAVNLAGQALKLTKEDSGTILTLIRPPYVQVKENLPNYLSSGYYYPDTGQPEVAILSGVKVDQVLALNAPAWQRWLPSSVQAEAVTAWQEAEDPVETTFVQPRVEGYSRYSGDAAIGMNTYGNPPPGEKFYARYKVDISDASSKFWLRRMDSPAMDLEIWIDGKLIGTIVGADKSTDQMHLSAWNAGIGAGNLHVGWLSLSLTDTLSKGRHDVEIVALPHEQQNYTVDAQLLGGAEEARDRAAAEAEARLVHLQCVQIDAFMFTR
jgi:hypothetical protein